MEIRLVYQKGRSASQVLRLARDETVIGRQSGSDIRIPSGEVSRRHCVLRKEDGVLTVEDLQSVNGTFVNGEPVVAKEVIRPGDRLQIGPVTFVVEYEWTPDVIDRMRQKRGGRPVRVVEPIEDEEELPEAEILEDEELEAVVLEDEEVAVLADDDVAPIVAEEDLSIEVPEEDATAAVLELADEGWQMPEPQDFRDILSGLDDASPPGGRKRRPGTQRDG